MSETQNTEQVKQTSRPAPVDPFEFLAAIPGAPSRQKIEAWKQEVPGGRVQLFSPDGKRVFILRGVSGLEMAKFQNEIPKNASNPEWELQLKVCAAAILWSNMGQMDEMTLKAGPAGLPESLWTIIQNLSDFYDPVQLYNLSAEL